jgi:hypothetical protein
MSSILLSSQAEAPQQKVTRRTYSKVRPRHRYVLELHLAGKKVKEIQNLTGYANSTIYNILASPEVASLRQQIMKVYDLEFEALYSKVIEAIEDGLDEEDIWMRLQAAKLWLKAHGKGSALQPPPTAQFNITAEDVVVQLLQQAKEDGRR